VVVLLVVVVDVVVVDVVVLGAPVAHPSVAFHPVSSRSLQRLPANALPRPSSTRACGADRNAVTSPSAPTRTRVPATFRIGGATPASGPSRLPFCNRRRPPTSSVVCPGPTAAIVARRPAWSEQNR
jgi:hypothetical protein